MNKFFSILDKYLLTKKFSSCTPNLAKMAYKSNICLYGPPGSGKSAVSKRLGIMLNMPVYDVDDDHLEHDWKMPVAKKLELLGDEAFLKAEEESTMKIIKSNTIISLSGSNPLSDNTMSYLRRNGLIVYIDVDKTEIIKRCHEMKVDRVVGMSSKTFPQILDFRSEIYEKHYDYRVIVGPNDTVNEIAEKVSIALCKNEEYVDLNDMQDEDDLIKCDYFEKVVFYCNDGEKVDRNYLPKFFPKFTISQLERLVDINYYNRCLRIIENFPIGQVTPQILSKISKLTYENYQSFIKLDTNTFLIKGFIMNPCQNSILLINSLCKILDKDREDKITKFNSINFAMLLTKIVAPFNAYLELVKKQFITLGDEVDVNIVITDEEFDLGNIVGLMISKKVGLPIGKVNIILKDEYYNLLFNKPSLSENKLFRTFIENDVYVANLERILFLLDKRDFNNLNQVKILINFIKHNSFDNLCNTQIDSGIKNKFNQYFSVYKISDNMHTNYTKPFLKFGSSSIL